MHSGLLDLDAYSVLILSTHPEYWSRRMYDRVKEWVFERGGRLMYLGGNGLNCEVEFLDDATIVCRNGDAREVTRRGLESRFHLSGESEANLLGVVYDERGIMTAAPFRVVDAGHWAFEGPGVGEGDVFGRESLHMRCQGGASGHETDKISPSSPANVRRLAKGMNPGDGGADMRTSRPRAAAPSSRPARSPGPARSSSTTSSPGSPPTCSSGSCSPLPASPGRDTARSRHAGR